MGIWELLAHALLIHAQGTGCRGLLESNNVLVMKYYFERIQAQNGHSVRQEAQRKSNMAYKEVS